MKNKNFFENPYLLLTPGPLSKTKTGKATMLQDWCTWDDDYNKIVQEIRSELIDLAGVSNKDYTLVLMQGSGTFSVESVVGSVIPHHGKLLVMANGAYGQRIATIANYLNIPVVSYLSFHSPLVFMSSIGKLFSVSLSSAQISSKQTIAVIVRFVLTVAVFSVISTQFILMLNSVVVESR